MILDLAPNGLVLPKCLQAGLEELLTDMPQLRPKGLDSEIWILRNCAGLKLMLGHLRQVKDNRLTPMADSRLDSLISKIDLHANPDSTKTSAAIPAASTLTSSLRPSETSELCSVVTLPIDKAAAYPDLDQFLSSDAASEDVKTTTC